MSASGDRPAPNRRAPEAGSRGPQRGSPAPERASADEATPHSDDPGHGDPVGEYPAIEDHGIIGDRRSAALVCIDGTIDFLCLPRYDAPSVFASLLDAQRGGRFALAPVDPPTRRQQMYLPDTNVLLTRFLAHEGVAEIVDFMPPAPAFADQAVIRVVRGIRGEIPFRLRFEPRFDYARGPVRLTHEAIGEATTIVAAPVGTEGIAPLRLRAPVELTIGPSSGSGAGSGADGRAWAEAEFSVGPTDTVAFVLEPAELGERSPYASQDALEAALDATVAYWRRWSATIQYRGRWADAVHRSALVLELLTCQEFGAIVAAPTFGLPEWIGGPANWDYRFCWTRDTSFAMQALTRLGLREEAWDLASWLERRCCDEVGPTPLEVLYTPAGGPAPSEQILDSLSGYRGSRPVRIGNAAAEQLQLDITGEFIHALYTHDPEGSSLPRSSWDAVVDLLDGLEQTWSRPDHGIWELRGAPRERLHSRVMTWIAFDRGLRLAQGSGRPAPVERWRAARDAIFTSVWTRFWDPEVGSFVGTPDGSLDAAALVMPLLDFIGVRDPCWRSTLAAIRAGLVEDSLVFRLEPRADAGDPDPDADSDPDPDAVPEIGHGRHPATFSLCTFWYVECLSKAERLYEARTTFERMLRHANHLGLYAEQLGPCGEHLGNFPQALTHIGLINAAVDLDARLDAHFAKFGDEPPRGMRGSGGDLDRGT